jgi:hypothetical protein
MKVKWKITMVLMTMMVELNLVVTPLVLMVMLQVEMMKMMMSR